MPAVDCVAAFTSAGQQQDVKHQKNVKKMQRHYGNVIYVYVNYSKSLQRDKHGNYPEILWFN